MRRGHELDRQTSRAYCMVHGCPHVSATGQAAADVLLGLASVMPALHTGRRPNPESGHAHCGPCSHPAGPACAQEPGSRALKLTVAEAVHHPRAVHICVQHDAQVCAARQHRVPRGRHRRLILRVGDVVGKTSVCRGRESTVTEGFGKSMSHSYAQYLCPSSRLAMEIGGGGMLGVLEMADQATRVRKVAVAAHPA